LPGEHPCITQQCVVVYERAEIVKADAVRAAVAGGALVEHDPLAPELLKRAFDALFGSPDTPLEILDYCADK